MSDVVVAGAAATMSLLKMESPTLSRRPVSFLPKSSKLIVVCSVKKGVGAVDGEATGFDGFPKMNSSAMPDRGGEVKPKRQLFTPFESYEDYENHMLRLEKEAKRNRVTFSIRVFCYFFGITITCFVLVEVFSRVLKWLPPYVMQYIHADIAKVATSGVNYKSLVMLAKTLLAFVPSIQIFFTSFFQNYICGLLMDLGILDARFRIGSVIEHHTKLVMVIDKVPAFVKVEYEDGRFGLIPYGELLDCLEFTAPFVYFTIVPYQSPKKINQKIHTLGQELNKLEFFDSKFGLDHLVTQKGKHLLVELRFKIRPQLTMVHQVKCKVKIVSKMTEFFGFPKDGGSTCKE